MKKLIYFVLLGSVLLLMSACESDGNFNVINRTSYPIYTSVEGGNIVTVPAGENHVFEVETGKQSFLTGEVSKRVPVYLVGETFSLHDKDLNEYVDNTIVTIKAGKTTNAYLAPNRASIKIVNNREERISRVQISQVSPTTNIIVGTIEDIPAGASHWKRVKYATLQDNFIYRLEIWLDGVEYPVNLDAPAVLGKDEQWLVNVDPPENR
ncbi:MAG: hypothetical protein RBR69_07040 [Candidatus Cloacimonadaceae bacterium]|jgi:hypothetical protein|nr:hypothetical protein [Candidatus Cloacimonadota bacterium]MDY0127867.1 hypothetical protein [Candidatus Cloacimonadaceae bacterium]MCB5254270.1 hypothetical protein [Candidatus Cloacimonadota bacterium]MCK9178309.1 hypothetical protein [Candidatus Cloacimonadota bacterium]MCK9242543.1 hypothetical protein [Candidatus Cloacimonadota bacterium]